MKRLCGLLVLMLMSSSAHAGTISFSAGGHRIRIEAPRGCSSSSCASISIPGVYESRSKRDDTRDIAASPPPAPAPAAPALVAPPPAPAPAQQSAPPAPKPLVATVAAPAPPAVYQPAAATTQEVAPPLPPVQPPSIVTQDCTTPPAARPDESGRPAPPAPPPVLKVLLEEDPDSPLGDWQTEGKGMVRIAECGRALCGYAIREGESEKGEAILINMKPKSEQRWSGNVYSRDSGDTYYGTMRMKGPNMLRVEACAFSRFYCNGGNWIRIAKPERMITSRQVVQEPRS